MADELAWGADSWRASARKLHAHAVALVDHHIGWYRKNSPNVRSAARALRVGAILAFALAGLHPVIAQICLGKACGPLLDNPVWASVIAAIGALFLSIDRFFGYSSAWMRYVSTEMELAALRDQFAFEAESRIVELEAAGSTVPKEEVLKLIAATGTFVNAAAKLVRDETNLWLAEFRDALRQIDESAKAVQSGAATGGVSIMVENGDQSEAGWQLITDDGRKRQYVGKTAALSGLAPGMHRVRVEGKVAGRPVAAEGLVSVIATQIAQLRLALA